MGSRDKPDSPRRNPELAQSKTGVPSQSQVGLDKGTSAKKKSKDMPQEFLPSWLSISADLRAGGKTALQACG